MTIHINIGSNLGCREEILKRAVADIAAALPGRMVKSEMIETPAWGYESANPYLNIGLSITLSREWEPLHLLDTLQAVQRAIDPSPHRDITGAYIDRAIDIDIIAIDTLVMDHPRLRLPHPRMHTRDFVLRPMAATAPGWVHPVLHLTPADMLTRLAEC